MTYTISELLFELQEDPLRRILFVEGSRDLAFWRQIIPTLERGDTVIYSISEVAVEGVEGGEKGRLVRCASNAEIASIDARVQFFADADYDRILEISPPHNVTLTDGRDLESYALFDDGCLRRLCTNSFAKEEEVVGIVSGCVGRLGRALSVVRIASLRNAWNLAIQTTLCNRGLKRFIKGKGRAAEIDLDKLLTNILQNSSISIKEFGRIKKEVFDEMTRCQMYLEAEIIRGKDLTRILAWCFEVDPEQMERLLFSCINYSVVSHCAAIGRVASWVRRGESAVSEAK